MTTARPAMNDYFRGRIAFHVHGMLSGPIPPAPREVKKITGDVTSKVIMVETNDGSRFYWTGGRYSTVKRNLCYAPLMPRPCDPPE